MTNQQIFQQIAHHSGWEIEDVEIILTLYAQFTMPTADDPNLEFEFIVDGDSHYYTNGQGFLEDGTLIFSLLENKHDLKVIGHWKHLSTGRFYLDVTAFDKATFENICSEMLGELQSLYARLLGVERGASNSV